MVIGTGRQGFRKGTRGNQYLTISGLPGLFLETQCTGVNHWVNCFINQVKSPWKVETSASAFSLFLSLCVLSSSWQVDNYAWKKGEDIEVTALSEPNLTGSSNTEKSPVRNILFPPLAVWGRKGVLSFNSFCHFLSLLLNNMRWAHERCIWH